MDRSRERLHRATGSSPIRVVHAGLFCDRFVSNDRAPHPCAAKMTVFLPNRLLRPSIAANSAGALGSAVAKRSACPAPSAVRSSSKRSEEHTSELQSLMRISYAVFCLKKKNHKLK